MYKFLTLFFINLIFTQIHFSDLPDSTGVYQPVIIEQCFGLDPGDEIGLFDWSPLMNINLSKDGKNGLDWNDNDIIAEYGIPLDSHWDETPLEIEKHLILKPWHLKNKKNLRKLKQDKRIKYTHSIAIEFDSSKNNDILKVVPGHWYSKITDGEEQANQVIEVED